MLIDSCDPFPNLDLVPRRSLREVTEVMEDIGLPWRMRTLVTRMDRLGAFSGSQEIASSRMRLAFAGFPSAFTPCSHCETACKE